MLFLFFIFTRRHFATDNTTTGSQPLDVTLPRDGGVSGMGEVGEECLNEIVSMLEDFVVTCQVCW